MSKSDASVATYCVVLRGASVAVFPQNETLEVTRLPGLVNLKGVFNFFYIYGWNVVIRYIVK